MNIFYCGTNPEIGCYEKNINDTQQNASNELTEQAHSSQF